MDTEQSITLTDAYTAVVEHFGADKAKALNRLTVLTVEAGHDRLVTEGMLHAAEERLEGKIDDLRKDVDNKFWVMIGLMITGFGGVLFAILGK